MIARRTALLAGLLLPAAAQAAQAPRGQAAQNASRRIEARLRPGGAPVPIELVSGVANGERLQRIRANGAEVILPSRHGGTGSARVLPLANREAVIVNMAGLTGTGVAQQLGAVIAADDQGRLRVIGLENLDARENGTCESEGRLTGRLDPAEGGTWQLACAFQRVRGPCGQRWQGTPVRATWTETLSWDGRGALRGEPVPDDASRMRHAAANARARVTAMLTPVVTDLRAVDWEATGIADLILLGLA